MIKQMVVSEDIEWIGYEQKRSLLEVEFLSGAVYQFDHVPECVYQSFVMSEDPSKFYEGQIKGHYPLRRTR